VNRYCELGQQFSELVLIDRKIDSGDRRATTHDDSEGALYLITPLNSDLAKVNFAA
jgi:hypothetical protein